MTDTLARIDWQMGQTLLPEHFVAQEDAILADTATRFGLLGLPAPAPGGHLALPRGPRRQAPQDDRALPLQAPGGDRGELPRRRGPLEREGVPPRGLRDRALPREREVRGARPPLPPLRAAQEL